MPDPAFTRDRPGAIVLDAFATGLNTARALDARGVCVAVVAMGDDDVAQYSRAVSEHRRLGRPASPEGLCGLLIQESDRWRGRVLIPASDLALETLSRFRSRLEPHYSVGVPEWSVTCRLLRKDLMRQAAEDCGVETPRSYGELTAAAPARGQLDYPVLVRPLRSATSGSTGLPKALLARSAADLDAAARRLADAGRRAEVLELVPGGDGHSYNYTAFLARDGRLCAGCALHKLRKSPPLTGIGRVAETVQDPAVEAALREPLLRVLRHVGWYGPVSAEFKRHPVTGRFVLIEINARMAFMFRLALARGLDFAWLSYRQALGDDLPEMAPSAWNGVLIHLHADLLNTLFRRRLERLGWRDFWAPYRREKVFAVWDARDPLPFLAEWLRSAARAPRSLVGRWRGDGRRVGALRRSRFDAPERP